MKKALVIASLGLASAAYAGTPVKSEFFYQTEPQKHQVTPELEYSSDKLETSTTGADSELTNTQQILNVRYEYGISEMFSTGAEVGYLTGDVETSTTGAASTTTDQKGLTDFNFFFKGNYAPMDASSMHYGINVGISPADREEDSTKKETNAVSGGMSMTPYVGYQWLVGAGVWGANLSHEMDLGDRSVNIKPGTTTEKRTGGNDTILTGFYEHVWEKWNFGGALSYISRNTLETDPSVGADEETTGGTYWRLRFYPTWEVNEMTTVLGEIAYTNFLGDSVTDGVPGTARPVDVDSSSTLSLQVGGRFTF